MSSKLKINLNEGILEVEGSEKFVKEIYEDFKEKLFEAPNDFDKDDSNEKEPKIEEKKVQTKRKKRSSSSSKNSPSKKRTTTKPDFSVLTDLNLRPKGKQSLINWTNQFEVKSNPEKILCIIYYCKEILKIDKVTSNHVYTGLKELKVKIPPSLYQVIVNTKNRKSWIQYDNMIENIDLTIQGSNYIEHDVKKKSN